MTARQPGVGTDLSAVWSPALARGLIRDEVMRSMRYCDGYTDLLGCQDVPREAPTELARWWVMSAVLRIAGAPISVVRDRVRVGLRPDGEARVLDVACGPGEDTAFLAGHLDGSGFVIGVDASAPMMRRAVQAHSGPHAVYMRADSRSLPFHDGAFDMVSCLAGLHLSDQPMAVLQEMVRVVAPRGRIAVLTSYRGESAVARTAIELAAAACGVRAFDRTTIPAFLTAAGLIDIDQQLQGISQFVTARRPECPAEINQVRVAMRA